MKIKFNDATQTELECLEAFETEAHYNGSNRRVLTITCAADAMSIDTLNTILSSEENVEHLAITNQEETATDINGSTQLSKITNILDGYVLKMEVGVKSIEIAPETPDEQPSVANRLVFKLGKLTPQEIRLASIEQKLAALGV